MLRPFYYLEIQPIAYTVQEVESVAKKLYRTCHGEILVPLPKAKSPSEKYPLEQAEILPELVVQGSV